jgi:hypothetical protein
MAPLETSLDSDRLCLICGWFGDQQETLLMPPESDVLNPVLAAAQALALYRDVCRKEFVVERACDAGNTTNGDLQRIHMAQRQAAQSIIEMFIPAGWHCRNGA